MYILPTTLSHVIDRKLVHGEGPGTPPPHWLKRHVVARVAHLALLPLTALACAADTVGIYAFGAASVLTGGLVHKPVAKSMRAAGLTSGKVVHHIKVGGTYVPFHLFHQILRIVNPKAEVPLSKDDHQVTHKLTSKVPAGLESLKHSKYILVRHIASRVYILGFMGVAVVSKVADGALGAVAAGFSLLTLGSFERLNTFAAINLSSLYRLPSTLAFGMPTLLINPWAFDVYKAKTNQ